MSLISKIQSLISSANAVTGESRTDLTSAVQDLKDGYGGSTVTKGLVFSEYDSDGFPTKMEFKGMTEIPYRCFYNGTSGLISGNYGFLKHFYKAWTSIPSNITSIGNETFRNCNPFNGTLTIHAGVTSIGTGVFWSNTFIQTLVFEGNVPDIKAYSFANCNQMTLADFSHHTGAIPTLYDTSSFQYKSTGITIKVPQALLSEWQTATNWSALTNVTWQGV